MSNQTANGPTDIDRLDIDRISADLEGITSAALRKIGELDLTLSSATHTQDILLRGQTSGGVMVAASVLLFGAIQSLRDRHGTRKPNASKKPSGEI